jgi:virulence-associated protein VagC
VDIFLNPLTFDPALPRDWRTYFASAPVASDAFMADVKDLPVQERED